MKRALVVMTLVLTATISTRCGESTGPAQTVDHIYVTGRLALRVGEVVQFLARAFDQRDKEFSQVFTWTSSDTTLATVTSNGLVTTLAPGQVTVSASAGGKKGEALIGITLRPVKKVQVLPATDSLFVGDSLQLTVNVLDSASHPLTGRLLTLRVSDTTKATISPEGLVHALAPGGFAVLAQSEGVSAGAFVTAQLPVAALFLPDTIVAELRTQVRVLPDLRSATGAPLADRGVTWKISDTIVAIVYNDGFIIPRRIGTTTLTASCCGGLADTSVVIIQEQPAASVTIGLTAGGTSVVIGDSTPASADLRDYSDSVVNRAVNWTSSDTTILRVIPDSVGSAKAHITATHRGSAELVATADGVADTLVLQAELPITRLVVLPETLFVRRNFIIGTQTEVYPTLQDSAGFVHLKPYPAWVNKDSAIAYVNNWTVFVIAPGTTMAIASVNYKGKTLADTLTIVVYPASGTHLDLPASVGIATTATTTIGVALRDSAGNPVAVGQNVHLTSLDTTIVTVTPALLTGLSGTGLVQLKAKRSGEATVVARTDTLGASLWVQVSDVPIASLSMTLPRFVHVGDSTLVPVITHGPTGDQPVYPLTWASSDSGVAIVTDSNVLIGTGPGTARITLSSGGLHDTATVVVESFAAATIDSFAPGILMADSVITIYGANFDPSPAQDQVRVDNVAATVIAATSTRLDVHMPPIGSWTCTPTHQVPVIVQTPAGLTAATATVDPVRLLNLAFGATLELTAPSDLACNELENTGASYDIAVVAGPGVASPLTAFELDGTAQQQGAGPTPPDSPMSITAGGGGDVVPLPQAIRDWERVDRQLLDASRSLAQRAGPPASLLRARPRLAFSVADSIGSMVEFRVPNVTRPDFCASYTQVKARRAYVGTHIDIYEDVASVEARQMDYQFSLLGAEFEASMYPLLLQNFGNPLALDSLLDRNGKIVMLVSPTVNPVALGFVVSCDFYPENVAPSSNTGEIMYVFAPTNTTSGFADGTIQFWQWLVRSVVMHESKHLTAYAERLSRGAPLEDPWLEEGSAVIAEELWARHIYNIAWNGDATYAQTLFCDVRPTIAPCVGHPYAMINTFASLYPFADGYTSPPGNEVHTPLGPTDYSDGSFYGSAWSLLRYTIDHYAVQESDFLKALVQEPTLTGIANLEARAGISYGDLSSRWLIATHIDDQPALTTPGSSYSFPSWNLPNIFAGMNADFPFSFPHLYPYQARTVAYGDFQVPVTQLVVGTGSLFRLAGAQLTRQLLELHAIGGGAPPPGLEIRILRVK